MSRVWLNKDLRDSVDPDLMNCDEQRCAMILLMRRVAEGIEDLLDIEKSRDEVNWDRCRRGGSSDD